MLFKASENIDTVEFEDQLVVKYYQEVETPEGWVMANKLNVRDWILAEDGELLTIKNIEQKDNDIVIFI